MTLKKNFIPTKAKIIATIILLLLGILIQLAMAMFLTSFAYSHFPIISIIVIPLFKIISLPIQLLISLITKEWWIIAVYIINALYIYFIVCLFSLIFSHIKYQKS